MFFIPRLFDGFRMTEVPSLIGRTMPEAMGLAEASGLTLKASEAVPTDDQPKGTVLTQDPPADRRTRRGTEIKVTISAGIRPPSVVGKPVDEARVILVRAGWNVAGTETRTDLPGRWPARWSARSPARRSWPRTASRASCCTWAPAIWRPAARSGSKAAPPARPR